MTWAQLPLWSHPLPLPFHLLCNSHTDLLPIPQTHQACFYLRAFSLVVLSAWHVPCPNIHILKLFPHLPQVFTQCHLPNKVCTDHFSIHITYFLLKCYIFSFVVFNIYYLCPYSLSSMQADIFVSSVHCYTPDVINIAWHVESSQETFAELTEWNNVENALSVQGF